MLFLARFIPALTLMLVGVSSISAELYILPKHREVIDRSVAIVIADVVSLNSRFDIDGSIVTDVDLRIGEVLKGSIDSGAEITVVEPGGEVGSQFMLVSAAPVYWVGNRALIFLARTSNDDWLLGAQLSGSSIS